MIVGLLRYQDGDEYHADKWMPVPADDDRFFRRLLCDLSVIHSSFVIIWRGSPPSLLHFYPSNPQVAITIAQGILAMRQQMETEDLIIEIQNQGITHNDAVDAMQHLVLTGMAELPHNHVLFNADPETVIEICTRRSNWITRLYRWFTHRTSVP